MQGFETTGISKFKDKGDNTEMALRTIRTEGDSVLEKICRPVEKIDKRTKDLVGDMLETMYDGNVRSGYPPKLCEGKSS